MAPKGGALLTDDKDLAPFGVKLNDMVRTPLGVTGTIIGVKYESVSDKSSGRVWVAYSNGTEAPLEPRLGPGDAGLAALGYARVQEADHIRRNLAAVRETLKREEKEREIAMKILELREKGQPVPEDLIAAHGRQ
mmetsp:Transcript_31545/g.94075  ORF Transcript_31545/g.94075 Transcript_31545/m.94075 type:complete len:135 (-) Transcript_31545:768-1172(-)